MTRKCEKLMPSGKNTNTRSDGETRIAQITIPTVKLETMTETETIPLETPIITEISEPNRWLPQGSTPPTEKIELTEPSYFPEKMKPRKYIKTIGMSLEEQNTAEKVETPIKGKVCPSCGTTIEINTPVQSAAP